MKAHRFQISAPDDAVIDPVRPREIRLWDRALAAHICELKLEVSVRVLAKDVAE